MFAVTPGDAFNQAVEVYLELYGNEFIGKATNMYVSITSPSLYTDTFAKNVKTAAGNHLPAVSDILRGTLKLMIEAVKLEISYLQLDGKVALMQEKEGIWSDRLTVIGNLFDLILKNVKDNYHTQMEKDIEDYLKENEGMSNIDFAKNLYDQLSKNYDWRDFLVISYRVTTGNSYEKQRISMGSDSQGSYFEKNKNKRNIIVASIDKNDIIYRMPRRYRGALRCDDMTVFGANDYVGCASRAHDTIPFPACTKVALHVDRNVGYEAALSRLKMHTLPRRGSVQALVFVFC